MNQGIKYIHKADSKACDSKGCGVNHNGSILSLEKFNANNCEQIAFKGVSQTLCSFPFLLFSKMPKKIKQCILLPEDSSLGKKKSHIQILTLHYNEGPACLQAGSESQHCCSNAKMCIFILKLHTTCLLQTSEDLPGLALPTSAKKKRFHSLKTQLS